MDSERSFTDGGASSEGLQTNSSESFETLEALKEAINLFQQATVAAYAKPTVGMFALIGLELGVMGYPITSFMLRGGGLLDVTLRFLLAMTVFSITLLWGAFPPIVAAVFSIVGLFAPLVLTSGSGTLVAADIVWIDCRPMGASSSVSG